MLQPLLMAGDLQWHSNTWNTVFAGIEKVYRCRNLNKACVKVLAGQYAQMLIQQLASLKISVEEMANYIFCLCDCF